ncbi:response regulator [Aquiflexum sp.]|uniref:response regulator n=1 Tax=Aquiflexum sp. TaxID=1872584 RepID=UPI0035942A88
MNNIHILLVEDNEGDIVLTLEAFEEAKIINDISIVRNGELAIDFLLQKGQFVDAKIPDLILMDINLPRINGQEVLQFIKSEKRLRHIPVVMLTTSSSPKDILTAYQNYASCFITKPVDVEDFLNVISEIENFWVKIIKLPTVDKSE